MTAETCWLCRRTKDEIMAEILRLENPSPEEMDARKTELVEEITLEEAEDSDYPHVKYCTVCENILADFAEKNMDDDEEDVDDESEGTEE